jgi:hypothetical protein
VQAVRLPKETGFAPEPNFFLEWTAGIRDRAQQLKQLRIRIAESWSTQIPDASYILLALWLYCRDQTQRRAQKSQMCRFLQTDETDVRKRLSRLGKRADANPRAFAFVSLFKEYAANCPAGNATLREWLDR